MVVQSGTGGCLCGKVRYEISGNHAGCGYCHCTSCRKHTGAPLVGYVVFPKEQVTWLSNPPKRYESSKGRFRAFCADCGTSLTWEGHLNGKDWVELHIGTFDNPDTFQPNEHTHYKERISWLPVVDDLPKYPGSIT